MFGKEPRDIISFNSFKTIFWVYFVNKILKHESMLSKLKGEKQTKTDYKFVWKF